MRHTFRQIKDGLKTRYENIISPTRPVYIFHHIPKSGGTSVRSALSKWFRMITDYRPSVELSQETVAYLDNKLNIEQYNSRYCIIGHFELPGNYLRDRYPQVFQNPGDFRVLSILREPLELAISLYYFKLKNDPEEMNKLSLEAFLNSVSNYTADRLQCTDKNYLDILNKYFFIGVNEQMQESFDQLARLLKKPRIVIPHLNRSKRDGQSLNLPLKVSEDFKGKNQLDYMIYNHVLQNLNISLNV